MPNEIYESIKAAAPTDLEKEIKHALQNHVGQKNRMTKEELAEKVFKKPVGYKKDLESGVMAVYYLNTSRDRQLRLAVANLVTVFQEGIVTDTDEGGFFYAATPEELDVNISDCSSRIDKLIARREGLYRAKAKRFKKVDPKMKTQEPLFDLKPVQNNIFLD